MRIAMPRGDIKWQRFKINTIEGASTDIDFTNVYFTVKKKATDQAYLFQKSLKRGEIYKIGAGDYQLKINPEDTNHLLVGNYKFDIQVSYKNLLKESFVGDFVIKDEVTYYTNEDSEEEETDFVLPQAPEQSTLILLVPEYHAIELVTPVEIQEVRNYEDLQNIPTINNIELKGDLTLDALGIQPSGIYATNPLTPAELDEIIES